jgi:hypothetical protein
MKSNITGTSENGRSTGYLPIPAENHDSHNRESRLFLHIQKDMPVHGAETIADRAERLAVIAHLIRIYSPEFIAATYGVSE